MDGPGAAMGAAEENPFAFPQLTGLVRETKDAQPNTAFHVPHPAGMGWEKGWMQEGK